MNINLERPPFDRPEVKEDRLLADAFFEKYPVSSTMAADMIVSKFTDRPQEGISYVEKMEASVQEELEDWLKAMPRSFQSFLPKNVRDLCDAAGTLEKGDIELLAEGRSLKSLQNELVREGKAQEESTPDDNKMAAKLINRLATMSAAAEELQFARDEFAKQMSNGQGKQAA